MKLFENYKEISDALNGTIKQENGDVQIVDTSIPKDVWADLAYTSVFGNPDIQETVRRIIHEVGRSRGIVPGSMYNLYMAIGRGEVAGFTMPAINLRTLGFHMACAAFRAAKSINAGALIMEIARSEIGYTDQEPAEFTANVIAAALSTGWDRPVFIQGDHFQTNRKKYFEDPDKEVSAIKDLISRAMDAGFYNIDVDTSTLVDISKSDLREQQHLNSLVCAEITKFIRERQPEGVTVSVGGEIGEIGGTNSTEEDMIAFMDGFLEHAADVAPISKMAVQTGTAHGGVVLPDGSIAKVKLDFDVLDKLGKLARQRYHIGGVVQHGASTLPEDLFDKFPKVNTLEIHLATQFQNIIYDLMPDDLRNEIYSWLEQNKKAEWKEGMTRQQFLYKSRKRALGAFKRQIWDMPEDVMARVSQTLETKFLHLFRLLNLTDTADKIAPFE